MLANLVHLYLMWSHTLESINIFSLCQGTFSDEGI